MADGLFPTEKGEGLSDRKVLILIFSALLIPGLLLVLVVPHNPGNRARLEQLRRLAAESPVHPDFKEIDSARLIKSTYASYSVYYRLPATSPASFKTVKKFYTEALTAQGWTLSGEEYGGVQKVSVVFHKGDYSITVTYDYGRDPDWDYAVGYGRGRP